MIITDWLGRGKLTVETEAFITGVQDLQTYRRKFLRYAKMTRICQSEKMDHFISGCSILAKHEYLERHNKICKYLHWNTCREYGMDGLPKEWYIFKTGYDSRIMHSSV